MDEGSQSNQQDDMDEDQDNIESLSQGIYNCRDRPLFERINEWELSIKWAWKHFVFTDIHDYSKLQKELSPLNQRQIATSMLLLYEIHRLNNTREIGEYG